MSHRIIKRNHTKLGAALITLTILCGPVLGQTAGQSTNSRVTVKATHLLGFAGAKSNATGTLLIQGDALEFHKSGKATVQVGVASIQDFLLDQQSQQVGGVPMTLGKAAVPFGGGRVVSLFAHQKYDILALEYVDSNGGLHGSVFRLDKGQGEVVRSALKASSGHGSNTEDESTNQSAAEVANEK